MWSSLPSSFGSTPGNVASPPPNCVSFQSSSVVPALEAGPRETPFPPPLPQAWGSHVSPQSCTLRLSPSILVLATLPPTAGHCDPSITVSLCVHLRRTLNGSET